MLGIILELEQLGDDDEGVCENLVGVYNLFLYFGLLVEALGVGAEVEVDELLKFFDFLLQGGLAGDHLLLGISGGDLTLGNEFLGLIDFVHLLLPVAEGLSLVVKEKVIHGREVDLKLTFFHHVWLGVFLHTHYLITSAL